MTKKNDPDKVRPVISVSHLLATALATLSAGMSKDLHLAQRYWGETPACGPVTIHVAPMTPSFTMGILYPAQDTLAETVIGSCSIIISPQVALYILGRNSVGKKFPYTKSLACFIIAHEYGHTVGYDDSMDPSSIEDIGPGSPDLALDPLCYPSIY